MQHAAPQLAKVGRAGLTRPSQAFIASHSFIHDFHDPKLTFCALQPVLAQQPDGDEREYPALRRLMTDNRFIKEQFTYYTKLQGLAERYLRETNDGSWARNAQHLANEVTCCADPRTSAKGLIAASGACNAEHRPGMQTRGDHASLSLDSLG